MNKYGKKYMKIFLKTIQALRLNIGIKYWGWEVSYVVSNEYYRLIFNLFTVRSNLLPHTSIWGNVEKSLNELKAVYGRCY